MWVDMLLYVDCGTIYFASFLLQVDERLVSGDGFMLNFLTVLQMLALKVKLDKVRNPS